MKNHNVLVLFFVLITTSTFSQLTFEKKWGDAGYQNGMSVCSLRNGGFAVTGVSSSDTSNQLDVFILRTDSTGDSLWTKFYGGFSANDFPSAITETYDGGLLISATTYSYSSQAPSLSDWWIIRTDSLGDTLWTKIIRKPGNDRMWYISENTDHSIICCGWMSTGGWAKGTLMKLSESGDSLWSVQIGSSGNSYSQFCRENYDGNYLVAGATLSGTFNGIVSEFDTSGVSIANHIYDKPVTAEIINTVEHLPQGGYLISAKTGTVNGYDVWILRTNDLWDTVWTKTFNDPVSMYNTEERFAFDVTGDGGCIFGGMKFGTTDMEAVLYRLDSTGANMWTSTFDSDGDDKMEDIIALNDGGFIFSGYTGLITNDSTQIYIVKTDNNGLVHNVTDVDNKVFSDEIIIFPNPSAGTIHFRSESDPIKSIKVYSVTGKPMYAIDRPADHEIHIELINSGIYLVEISTKDNIIRRRIIVNSLHE